MVTFIPTNEDRYGRTIAKIYYDEKYLSEEIIKAGFGRWYQYYSDSKNLGVLESIAKANKLGLWSDPKAISLWEYWKLKREKLLVE